MKVLWYGDFYGVQERQLLIWVVERYFFWRISWRIWVRNSSRVESDRRKEVRRNHIGGELKARRYKEIV